MSEYTRDDVIRILGYHYNGGRYGDITDPPPGMPKGKGDPTTGGVSVAEIIDVKRALDKLPLENRDRAALFLLYGCEATLAEVAVILDTPRYSVERFGFNTIGIILSLLNKKEGT